MYDNAYINFIIFFSCSVSFSLLLYIYIYIKFYLFSLKEERYRNRRSYKVYKFGTTTVGFSQTINNSHFFILSILFIIFDVELLYLYVWVLGISTKSVLLYKITFIIFVNLVFIGLFYELLNNLLTWYISKTK